MKADKVLMRAQNRLKNDLRPIEILVDVASHADGSCLIKMGGTHVLCAVSLESQVPSWRKGSGSGWLSAEYNLLPQSTTLRVPRERRGAGGRTYEIQRLIGRALRSICCLEDLGEKTLLVDCDVINADGGTRCAAITGASIALHRAAWRWLDAKKISAFPLKESIAAVSCGLVDGEILLDLDYEEDSRAMADSNIVITASGKFAELQISGEAHTFTDSHLEDIVALGRKGCRSLEEIQKNYLCPS